MKILVVNCGSSSIKYQLYAMPQREVLAKGQAERIGEPGAVLSGQADGRTFRLEAAIADHEEGMRLILQGLTGDDERALHDPREIVAVGHRVVHGGEEFSGSVAIDDRVLASIERCADLAPLHNPANLTGIRAAMHALPSAMHVACFDTAFHATIPPVAYLYALPYAVYTNFGVRRYGFHGSSHRYVAGRTAVLLGRDRHETNCITVHLGNGCSITAVHQGRSVDTSMGLTPLEGLVMGTRSGDIDPAILFYLADKGYDLASLNRLCNKESGLLGVSGVSNDMRTVTEAADGGHARAALAVDVFCYRVRKYIGAYLAVLGHVDAISFTGGIGERACGVRARICQGLEPLGIELDSARNAQATGGEATISRPASRVRVLVVPTDEEGVIAADTYQLVEEGRRRDGQQQLSGAHGP
ncbi:MAG: acetate kinase [Pirellulaceae bacterium]|jgi:acetate kinase|nr:acetate kinase [Pirellulaceae bacterium]